MAQLFKRSANYLAKASLVLVILLGGLAFIVYTQVARSSYLTGQYQEKMQPVQFSHKHHVGDDGIDCRYCHTAVETSSSAGMPSTQTCMACHSQVWSDSEYLKIVRDSWDNKKPIPWVRVHDLPEYTYFNHSIHVAKGVGCSTCHGNIAAMPVVYKQEALYMSWCLNCHRNPEQFLRPQSEIYNTAWQPPADQIAQGLKLKEEYGIRTSFQLTNCSICHR